MKIVLYTQCYENYGSPDSPHWKAKGGDEFVIHNVTVDANNAAASIRAYVDRARPQIDQNNEMFQENIISWELVDDDFQTEFERDQMEFEGVIRYPAKPIQFEVMI